MTSKPVDVHLRAYRWGVFSRVVAAIGGGYLLSALLTAVLSLGLPHVSGMSRAESVMSSSMASFTVYTIFVIWVFSARTASRVWMVLVIAAISLTVLLMLLRTGT